MKKESLSPVSVEISKKMDSNGICRNIDISSVATSTSTKPTTHLDISSVATSTSTKPTTPIDRCSPNPCKNGGTCEMIGADYNCSCFDNIHGKDCENCTERCGDEKCAFKDFFYCECENGKYFQELSKTCVEIDKCVQVLWEGKCRGRYEFCKNGECVCKTGYSYSKEKVCQEKCNCRDSEKCIYSEYGEGSCVCKEKHYFTGTECVKEDACALRDKKCEQKCDDGKCSCDSHYTLEDDYRCVLKENSNPCKDNNKCLPGKCLKKGDVETCICPEKTHHSFKENCTDLCTAKMLPHGTCPTDECIPHENYGFICNCTGRFKLSTDGIHCVFKKMCSEGGKNNECGKLNAHCVEKPDLIDGYACNCENGFDKDNGICIHKCDIKENEEKCLKMSAKCILDENHEPDCKCPPLFVFEKVANQKKCVKAKFSYTGNFTVPGKTYENNKIRYSRGTKRSTPQVDYVALYRDFKYSLTNVYGKDSDFFILGCETQQEDFKCELEMKFKEKPDEKKLNSIADPSLCIPLGNTDYCIINPNLIMKKPSKGVLRLTDPCEETVKNQICGPTTNCKKRKANNKLFDCICKDGYSTRGVYPIFEGEENSRSLCEDINECLKSTSCPKNSYCFNTPGSYNCFCNKGFRNNSDNVTKDGCIGVCEHKLCGEHGRCQAVGSDGYFCNCTDHYLGQFCNVTNPALKDLKKSGITTTAIVGGVLGGVLIIVLIAGFVYFRRNKMFVNNDEEYSKHRERAIYAERARQGIRQKRDGSGNRSDQHSLERRGSGDYRQYRNGESHMIPRVQTGTSRPLPDMSDDNKIYTNDDRRPQREHFSDDDRRSNRQRGPEAATHRSLNRSSDQLDGDGRRVSVVQYKNRGYEED